MKQFAAILLIFFLSLSVVQAAPVGSPASLLEKGQWDFAIEGGYISRRPMDSGNANYEASIIHGYHSRSYGLTDRLMITGRIGGTNGYIYDETVVAGTEGKTSLSGGLGLGLQLKGIIWENKDTGLEWDAGGQYLYMRSHHKSSGKANADWYEWQFSTCLVKAIGRFKPYAGVKFSTVDLDHDDGEGNKTSYDEDGSVGPFIGTDICFGEDRDVVIYLEGAFLIGDEFYGGIKYKF